MSSASPEIEAVIFDLGNVLVNFDAKKSAFAFAKTAGISILKTFSHFFLSEDEKAYTRGELTTPEFYERSKSALGVDIDFDTFKHYWNDIFWENEGMDELLAALKPKYKLYLISNTNELHFDYIRDNFNILRHFDRMFPSHEVGARKPEARIFENVLDAVKLPAAKTVFIDDIKDFIRAAKEVGMHGIVFKNKDQLIEDLEKLGVTVPAE